MKYFQEYFNSYQFWPTIKNTLVISLYTILVTFPLPIVVALLCNQISSRGYKKNSFRFPPTCPISSPRSSCAA